jgi:hypothetical protein
MPKIFQLVYVSVARAPFTAVDLADLLEQSRERNLATGITGLLLHDDGNFMQALEGDREAVLSIFESIKRDTRHRDVLTLLTHQVDQRDFAKWSMAWRWLDADESRPEGFSAFFDQPVDVPTAAPRALRLLHLFRANAA